MGVSQNQETLKLVRFILMVPLTPYHINQPRLFVGGVSLGFFGQSAVFGGNRLIKKPGSFGGLLAVFCFSCDMSSCSLQLGGGGGEGGGGGGQRFEGLAYGHTCQCTQVDDGHAPDAHTYTHARTHACTHARVSLDTADVPCEFLAQI